MNKVYPATNRSLCLLYYILQAVAVLLIATISFRLYSYDLRVPFNYSGDSVIFLMYIKGLIQDGWPTTISQLSAPFTYSGAAFPILTSVDWLVMKMMSIFTHEPGYLLNGFWLLTLIFTAWSATYASYQLGLSRILSFVSGILYAFLPYALMRNVSHISLVYYLVPLICLLVAITAGARGNVRNEKQAIWVGLIACALQGFNYIYYSFFAVLIFGFAFLISYRRSAGFKQLKLPALAILIVVASTSINLIPALHSFHKNGSPPEMGYKNIAEAEIYGAKIRRMLLPHPSNFIFPLARIGQKDLGANFPNENENATSRLGLYGSFGLLLMIAFALRRSNATQQPMTSLVALGLATLLIITVGGFGAIINLLTVPDIRAYNRFSVFLSFFILVIAGLWLQMQSSVGSLFRRVAFWVFIGVFMIFSLYDQLLDKKILVATQENDIQRAHEERIAVERLELALPSGALILQLPFTGFPPLVTLNKMESYDHVRPYLWSQYLRWSWPSFSQRHRAWQSKLSVLQGEQLIKAAIFSGFDAIWIDRFAYADNGNSLIESLARDKAKQMDLGSNRFVVIDLRDAATSLKNKMSKTEFSMQSHNLLGDEVIVEWGKGFYSQEQSTNGRAFRWAQDKAWMTFRNSGELAAVVCASFDVASPNEGVVGLDLDGKTLLEVKTTTTPKAAKFSFTIRPGEVKTAKFYSDLVRLEAQIDPRKLYFYVMDFAIATESNLSDCQAQ